MKPQLPGTQALVDWVGAPYGEGRCWNLVRDALIRVAGLNVPESYYDFARRLTQVHDARNGEAFTPQPWDLVMLRVYPRCPILVLHPGLCLDGDRFLHSWGSAQAVISSLTDPDWRRYVAGFVRIFQ